MYHQQWRWWDEANSVLQDILSGIRVVKAFGAEKREVARFTEDSAPLARCDDQKRSGLGHLIPIFKLYHGLRQLLHPLFWRQVSFRRSVPVRRTDSIFRLCRFNLRTSQVYVLCAPLGSTRQ